MPLLNTADALYLGSTEVTKVYLGATQVYPHVAPPYSTGFSNSLFNVSGENASFVQRTVDISAYAGATVRLVFRYQNGNGFGGDIQLDDINLDGTAYSFENETHSFQTSNGDDYGTYAGVTWANVAVESNNDGRWQVHDTATPSNNTGGLAAPSGNYFIYAETSSPANQLGYNR